MSFASAENQQVPKRLVGQVPKWPGTEMTWFHNKQKELDTCYILSNDSH